MSSGPISVAETWSESELVRAGWTAADLDWEARAEAATAALGAGDAEAARTAAGETVQLARKHFHDGDPRLGTSLALYALALGDAASNRALLDEAQAVWERSDRWIADMTAPRSARSSLFHMRMEQRHRPTYEARWKVKWAELAEDARDRIAQIAAVGTSASGAEAAAARWRRERPAMLNDTRKLMAAVLLLPEADTA